MKKIEWDFTELLNNRWNNVGIAWAILMWVIVAVLAFTGIYAVWQPSKGTGYYMSNGYLYQNIEWGQDLLVAKPTDTQDANQIIKVLGKL